MKTTYQKMAWANYPKKLSQKMRNYKNKKPLKKGNQNKNIMLCQPINLKI